MGNVKCPVTLALTLPQVNNYTLNERPRGHQLTLVVRDPWAQLSLSSLILWPGHN